MGGEAGFLAQAIYRTIHLREQHNFTLATMTKKDREVYDNTAAKLKLKAKTVKKYQQEEVIQAEALLEAAKHHFKIPFEEMLLAGPQWVSGPDQLSTWRPENAVWQPMVNYYSALGIDIRNSMLAFQFTANPLGYEGKQLLENKRNIMRRMAYRTPSVVLQYDPEVLDEVRDELAKAGFDIDTNILLEALAMAENRIAMDFSRDPTVKNYIGADVNLSDQAQFDEIVAPFIEAAMHGHEFPATLNGQKTINMQAYFKAVQMIREKFLDRIDNHDWYKFDWPLTLRSAETDLTYSDFAREGGYSQQRRQNDNKNALQANNIHNDYNSNRVKMFPTDIANVRKDLAEYAQHITAYLGPEGKHAAMQSVKRETIQLFEENMYKGRWILGWIPFSDSLMRSSKTLRQSKYSSRALKYNGPTSNLWDEDNMLDLLTGLLDDGTIDNEVFNELVGKYHLGLVSRVVALFRRNWLLLPAIFAYLAYKEVEKDEKTGHR